MSTPIEVTVGDPKKHHVRFFSVDPPTPEKLKAIRQRLAWLDEHCTGEDCPHTFDKIMERYAKELPLALGNPIA